MRNYISPISDHHQKQQTFPSQITMVSLVNEHPLVSDALIATTEERLEKCPAYRRRI